MRVALVTGASRGIGRETAIGLAAKGFTLFLAADQTDEELSDVAAACRAAGAPEAVARLTDLSVAGQAEAMIDAALGACKAKDATKEPA